MSEQYDLSGNQVWQKPILVYPPVYPTAVPLPTVPPDATCASCRYFGEKLTKEKTMANLCFAEPMIIYRDAIDIACHRYQEKPK